MPNWTWQTLHFLQVAALGVWLGGMVTIGVLVAPAVFALAPTRADAGRIMAAVFARFDRVVLACIVLLAISSGLLVGVYGRLSPWYAIQYVCLGMMSASALFGILIVSPRIRRLRRDHPEARLIVTGCRC